MYSNDKWIFLQFHVSKHSLKLCKKYLARKHDNGLLNSYRRRWTEKFLIKKCHYYIKLCLVQRENIFLKSIHPEKKAYVPLILFKSACQSLSLNCSIALYLSCVCFLISGVINGSKFASNLKNSYGAHCFVFRHKLACALFYESHLNF